MEETPDEDDGEAEAHVSVPAEPRVRLNSGEVLRADGLEALLAFRPATRISIVGESFSGKTTLVCAIYDQLLRGPFSGLSFVNSRTLVDLEKRIYPSRIAAGLPRPDTPRTSITDGLVHFHFGLADSASRRIDLLLSDRAGETYRRARANPDQLAGLTELSITDRIAVLLDGGKVTDPFERAGAMQAVRQLLRALTDNVEGCAGLNVEIITTKIDLIAKAEDKDALEQIIQDYKTRLLSDFGSKFRDIKFWDVAARDPDGIFGPAFGLDAMLADWSRPRERWIRPQPTMPPLTTEFDRLLTRTGTIAS